MLSKHLTPYKHISSLLNEQLSVWVFFPAVHGQDGPRKDLNYVNNVTPFEQLHTREKQWHKEGAKKGLSFGVEKFWGSSCTFS